MIYYLFAPNDDNSKSGDYNTLGESSFKNFWVGDGWNRLTYYSTNTPEILEKLIIKTSSDKEITLEEFVKIIKKLNIIQ